MAIFQKSLFMEAEIWILYNLYGMAQNIIFRIFLIIKNIKNTLNSQAM